MTKCDIQYLYRDGHDGRAEATAHCIVHGVEMPASATVTSGLCVVGMAEQIVNGRMIEVEAKLDQILAALARIEGSKDTGFCKGHPFQHSIMADNGMCNICGKPFNPSLRTTL